MRHQPGEGVPAVHPGPEEGDDARQACGLVPPGEVSERGVPAETGGAGGEAAGQLGEEEVCGRVDERGGRD